jgi:hypothetical protein
LESRLHREYKHKRIRGEWFKLGADEITDIWANHQFSETDEAAEQVLKIVLASEKIVDSNSRSWELYADDDVFVGLPVARSRECF